jgi:hypothetical protein
MNRWLPILALACAACSPAETPDAALALCPRVHETCPVVIERSDYWSELPATLAQDEAVVEAVAMDGFATTTRSLSDEIIATSTGEERRACTQVRPVAVQRFRVTRVVSGAFYEPEFLLLTHAKGCDSGRVALGLIQPPSNDKPAYLVIRPSPPLEGLPEPIATRMIMEGHYVKVTVPLMTYRPEGQDIAS